MPHDPTLFLGTAPYYVRYRPAYPADLFALLMEWAGLSAGSRVLDLGCGPGLLALPLAERGVAEVVAVDPDPGMVAETQRQARERGLTGVRCVQATAEALPDGLGPLALDTFDLVTIGDAFHWMDRPAVLERLFGLTRPGGGVVIAGNRTMHGETGGPKVQAAIQQTLGEFLGPERRAGRGVYRAPEQTHEEVIAASPFGGHTVWQLSWEESWPVEGVVGFQHSASFAAPHLLGERLGEFDRVLTRRLLELEPGGLIPVERQVTALLLRR